MKLRLLLLGFLASFFLSGCMSTLQKLPPLSGDALIYERHDPFGGTVITAKAVVARPDGTLTAEEAEWTTTYPQFGLHIKVLGYKQGATAGANPSKP